VLGTGGVGVCPVVRPDALAVPQRPPYYTHPSLIWILRAPVHAQQALPPELRPDPGQVVKP